MIGLRGGAEIFAALNAAAAAEADNLSRSEIIRRIVVGSVSAKGSPLSIRGACREHVEGEIQVQANVDAKRRNARARRGD